MTAIAFGSLFAVALLGIVWAVQKLPGSCSGDCNQGRNPCNCKNKWEK